MHTKIIGGDDVLNCTFAGHREVLEPSMHNLLVDSLEKLVRKSNEIAFYTGGMGEFDAMCGAAVRQLKRHFPEKKICLYLVCPYMTMSINRDAYYLKEQYDDPVYGPTLFYGIWPGWPARYGVLWLYRQIAER